MDTSSPVEADDEDEVEFVSEAPLRPVLECIDLLSDGEADGGLPAADMQVAVEKRERAERCRAFKESQRALKALGQRLAEARRCVDMWMEMPGLRPGALNAGAGRRRRSEPAPSSSSSTHTCPVINCRRVYDHVALLDGHLKRFDHSPCDPSITLRGSPSELFGCVSCGQTFPAQDSWKLHLQSKVSSSSPEGHALTTPCQVVVCFACPACYLLFYLRDECLQHMAANNHFTQALGLGADDTKRTVVPVPVPRYAKERLVSLCKDVAFRVRCSLCSKRLQSHMEAKAHFNVQCRQGCLVAEADQTPAEVMRRLLLGQQEAEPAVRGAERALLHLSSHWETQNAKRAAAASRGGGAKHPDAPGQARRSEEAEGSPAKRTRRGLGPEGGAATGKRRARGGGPTRAWFCECGLRFSEEATAGSHVLAANQIFHQCGVCGKQMGEAAITRLHMSRFHGGAHLSNFLFHCRRCGVDMPRHDDILSHVADAHSGHGYFSEREVPEEGPVVTGDAAPSTSAGERGSSGSGARRIRAPPRWVCRMCEDVFDSEAAALAHCRDPGGHSFQRLACGDCPQRFFKDATLRRHCASEHPGRVARRFFCGLCDGMLYDAEEEFLEHYRELHSRDYYRMEEPEDEGEDGRAVPDRPGPPGGATGGGDLLCPCMATEKSPRERKAPFTLCMKRLAGEGTCRYVCAPCGLSCASYAQIKTHVRSAHAALGPDEPAFHVECRVCETSHADIPGFHHHYHARHCPLRPCRSPRKAGKTPGPDRGGKEGSGAGRPGESSSGKGCEGGRSSQARGGKEEAEAAPPTVKTLNGVEIKPVSNAVQMDGVTQVKPGETRGDPEDHGDDSDEEMKHALALSVEEASKTSGLDIEMEEALQRSLLDF